MFLRTNSCESVGETPDGSVQCVLDGDLYNRADVRKFVTSRTRDLRTDSNAELIAHLWQAKGRDMLMSLRGGYALAILDRANSTLFVARDALGHRPLFVYEGHEGWAVGSDLRAVLAWPATRPALETRALDHFLAYHIPPQPLTLFRNVRKILPAGWLEIRNGRVEEGRYWEPTYYDPAGQNPDEVAQHAFSYLFESVKAHTRDLDRPTVCLEGDPYSAVLAGLASLAKRGRFTTFSLKHAWIPAETRSGTAAAVARFGCPHHEEEVAGSIAELLDAIADVNIEGLPISRMAQAMLFAGSASASSPGVLTAAGGELYWLAGRRPVPPPLSTLGAWRQVKESGGSSAGLSVALRAEFEARMTVPTAERASLAGRPGIPALDAVTEVMKHAATPGEASAAAYVDAACFLPDLFISPIQAACRARGFPARSPLADPSAVQLLVPVVHSLAGQNPLQGLRRVFESLVPEDAFWNARWSRPEDWETATWRELGERACDSLTERRSLERGLFEGSHVRRLVEDQRAGRERNERKLLLLFALELWMRSGIDPR